MPDSAVQMTKPQSYEQILDFALGRRVFTFVRLPRGGAVKVELTHAGLADLWVGANSLCEVHAAIMGER